MAARCCSEPSCKRSKPPLVRRGGLSGRWYLVLDYTETDGHITAKTKHDITDEINRLVLP